ncbi:MAG: MFS transporter [Ornithinimicrobium sp.]
MTDQTMPPTDHGGDPQVEFSSAQGRWILLAAILGSGLAGIDATVVNVALPAIGTDLGAGFAGLQWTVTAYTLTLAAFVLSGGALADRFGRRRIFAIGIIWFAVASLLCGLAPGIGTLVAARTFQGVGAALLVPGSLAMIQSSFVPADRARAIGAWSGLGGVATAIGPFLGGWLVESVSWRWVFFINAPLAIVVVAVVWRHVPETRAPDREPVDLVGAGLAVLSLAGVTYALVEQPSRGFGAPTVWGAALIGLAAAVAFLVTQSRLQHPMLPLGIFSSAQFSAANAVTFTAYGGFGAVFFLLVIQLQVVSGFSPLRAGISILPITLLMLLLSARSGELANRIGPRLQMSVGPVVCAVGLLLMLRIGPDADYVVDVLPGVGVFGFGLAIMVAPLTATALAAAPDEHAGLASGVNNAVARAAGLLAIAVLPAVVGIGGADYTDPVAFNNGFDTSLWIAAGVLTLGACIAAATISNTILGSDEPAARSSRPKPVSHCAVGGPPLSVTTRPQGADRPQA